MSRFTISNSRSRTGATVPLYYENRVPRMELTNEELNEELEGIFEAAELDETQERRIEQEFVQYQVITREERLEAIAEDIVSHFYGTWLPWQGDGHLDRQSHRRQDV